MPQSVKPTPPQQSSLTEMWGGKKKLKAIPFPPSMNIGDDEATYGILCIIQFSQTL